MIDEQDRNEPAIEEQLEYFRSLAATLQSRLDKVLTASKEGLAINGMFTPESALERIVRFLEADQQKGA
jgi:hypothetical protein